MGRLFAALLTGTLFGAGLTVGDMVNPARVIAFLDLFGNWDPSLAFVMGGALVPSAIGYAVMRRMERPLLHPEFHVPQGGSVDPQLLIGGAMFGAGWGLAGYCPGPALAGLVFGAWQTFVFVAAMVAGMWLYRAFEGRRAGAVVS